MAAGPCVPVLTPSDDDPAGLELEPGGEVVACEDLNPEYWCQEFPVMPPSTGAFYVFIYLYIFSFVSQIPVRVVRERDAVVVVFPCRRLRRLQIQDIVAVRVYKVDPNAKCPKCKSQAPRRLLSCWWGVPTSFTQYIELESTSACANYRFTLVDPDDFVRSLLHASDAIGDTSLQLQSAIVSAMSTRGFKSVDFEG